MEPTNHPIRKENHLPNLHDFGFHINFPGVYYTSHWFLCLFLDLQFLIQVIIFVIFHGQYGVILGSRQALKQTRAKRCGHGSCPNEDGEEGSSGDCGEILWKANLGFSDARILQVFCWLRGEAVVVVVVAVVAAAAAALTCAK